MRDPFAILITLVTFILLVVLIGHGVITHQAWTSLRITGFAVCTIGLALLAIARLQLGDSFSVAPEARKLVTHGLYSKVRNPVYVFGIVALAGFGLYSHQWIIEGQLAFLIPMQVVRARAEAKVLEEKFGEEYRRYRAGTWF